MTGIEIDDEEGRRLARLEAADEEYRHFEEEEEARVAAEEKAKNLAEERSSGVESMVTWFFENFEDPANETPWDGEDKAYVYIWGGPFDANDVIGDNFSQEFPEEWIEEAVELVQADGNFEWAPSSSGNYYEHPEPETEDDTVANMFERERELRESISRQLDALEVVIAQLPVIPANIGHNNPPDEIGLPPYDNAIKGEIETNIGAIRGQLAHGLANREILRQSESDFRRIGTSIFQWLGRKGDLFVDEAIKNSVKAIVWSGVAASLLGLADDIARWISSIY